jgi:hypothetical protein
MDLLPVVVDDVVEAERTARLYELYLDAFSPLRTRAAARHLVSWDEFSHEMGDARILKYSVWQSPDEPVALATITTSIEAMPWISPDFYASRHPAHAARQAIYYLGLALISPARGQYRLLERVVRAMVGECAAVRGVLAYDVCQYNDTVVHFGRRAEAILRRMAPVSVEVADVQTYYEAVFE